MNKSFALVLGIIGSAGFALAGIGPAPEIDPSAIAGALTLLVGGVLVIRSRRRKRP